MAKKILFAAFFTTMIVFLSISNGTQNHEKTEMNIEKPKQVSIETAKGIQETIEQRNTEAYREGLAAYIRSVNKTVTEEEARDMVDSIMECSQKYGVDEKLVMAIAHTESTYYSDAVSYADYKGLMQTGDVLAEKAGYSPQELFDPAVSINVGTSYIDEQLETFGDTRLALTAYNQGAGSVYSGDYSTDYADLAMARVKNVEAFLTENGYIR